MTDSTERTPMPMPWLRAALWAALAGGVAMGLMFWLRAAFQVRTLPERMMEWLLLYVPIDEFAKGIQTLGPKAKVYALYGSGTVMTLILLGLGTLALRRRWSSESIFAIAGGLFLVAMAGLMPLTGGGFFGTALPQHPLLVNAVYAAIALGYATVLLAGGAAEHSIQHTTALPAARTSRRVLALGAAGTGVATVTAWRQALVGGGAAGSSLPLAELPAGLSDGPSLATATVHPGLRDVPTTLTPEVIERGTGIPSLAAPAATAVTDATAVAEDAVEADAPASPEPPGAVPAASAPVPTPNAAAPTAASNATEPTVAVVPPAAAPTQPPAPNSTADTAPLPAPAADRQLTRDQDGALTAAARPKGELAPLITPVAAHYVVTKNAVADPSLDADGWRLVLDGEVNRPVQLDYRTLRRLPAVELYKTLECISNFTAMCELTYFGCDLISTSFWKGARLKDVLDLAGGLKQGVVNLQVMGADEFSSSIPVALAADPDTLLAYEMNGQPLPRTHGFPVRLLSPGRYGFKSCKWVVGIRALRTEYVDWYGQRNWSRTGVVKTMSRIDSPFNGAKLSPGRYPVSGIAYAGNRGVGAVQISPNGGRTWAPTVFIEPAIGKDAWVRWTAEFDVAPGQTVRLQCRAIDANGEVQPDVFYLPQPNGGSGRHTIEVFASA
jgi:DMSO/TMAO reductase YedYZ molybdopterin-dependent catalytic subunit